MVLKSLEIGLKKFEIEERIVIFQEKKDCWHLLEQWKKP